MLPPLSCRYSFGRISPCTAAVLPLFSAENIPQYRSASDTIQLLPACQLLTGCESFNKPLLPAKHTPAGQHTRTGKDSQYKDYYYNNN